MVRKNSGKGNQRKLINIPPVDPEHSFPVRRGTGPQLEKILNVELPRKRTCGFLYRYIWFWRKVVPCLWDIVCRITTSLPRFSPYAPSIDWPSRWTDVDSIDGLPPAVALQQREAQPSVRSSVASVSDDSNGPCECSISRAGQYPPVKIYSSRLPFFKTPKQNHQKNTKGACSRMSWIGRVF